MKKPANTQVPIQEIIANRWSGRAYDANKNVSKPQILALLEAARWAPSCFGDQPWRFLVWDKHTDTAAWRLAFDCLVPANQIWAKDAPVLILACANTLFDHNGKENRFAQYDTGAAVENLVLQAESMGLMTHQMGGFSADLARDQFQIPAQFTPMVMMTVGYQGDIASLPEDLKNRDLAERKRKNLGEIAYAGKWNEAL